MLIEAEKELLEGEGIEALVEKRTGSKNSIFYDKELKYFKRTLRTRIEERKRSIADTKRDYLAEAPKADSFSHYRFRPRFRGNERNGEGIDDLDPDFQFIIDNHLDAEIFDKKITRDLGKTGLTEGLDYHIIKEEKHRTAAFKEIEHAVNFGMRYYNHYMSTHRR